MHCSSLYQRRHGRWNLRISRLLCSYPRLQDYTHREIASEHVQSLGEKGGKKSMHGLRHRRLRYRQCTGERRPTRNWFSRWQTVRKTGVRNEYGQRRDFSRILEIFEGRLIENIEYWNKLIWILFRLMFKKLVYNLVYIILYV